MENVLTHGYSYFVSYAGGSSYVAGDSLGFGMAEIHLEKPVRSFDDIKLLKSIIEKKPDIKNVTILNYKLIGE